MHQPDGTLSDDENCVVRNKIEQFHTLKNCIERFDKSCLLKRHAIRNPNDSAIGGHKVHDTDIFGKSTARGFEARGHANLLVERALGGCAFAAVVALPAWDVVEHHHAFPNFKLGHVLADGHDGTGHLVAKDARGRMRSGVNLLEVCTANAAGGNLDQQLTASDGRDGDCFHAHIVDAAIDHGTHRGRQSNFSLELTRSEEHTSEL